MKKMTVVLLSVLLSMMSISHVLADYDSSLDVIDPIQGLAVEDCEDLTSRDSSPYIGAVIPVEPPEDDCEDFDPCEILPGLDTGILPEFVSNDLSSFEATSGDEIEGLPPVIIIDGCEDEVEIVIIEQSDDNDSDGDAEPEPSDIDGDGIIDAEDNCVFSPNSDQADSFGTEAGDACESPYRSDNSLVFGFFGSDGVGLYGFCSEEGCRYIATALVDDFANIMASDAYEDAGNYAPELEGGKVLNIETLDPSNMTVLFIVGNDQAGNSIYQLNVYLLMQKLTKDGETEIFPMLVDDDINITIAPDGTWTWRDKNPN